MLKWIAGFCLFLLTACGDTATPPTQCTGLAPITTSPLSIARAAPATPEAAVANAVSGVFSAPGPLDLRRAAAANYLALSTGGEWAAFSSGVLSGWSQNRRGFPRPDFDIVTGASAGATVAPAAFAGRAFDAQLPFATPTDTEGLAEQRFLLSLLFANSVYDAAGLERLAARAGQALFEPISDPANTQRALLIGAVNLETTRLEIFDLAAYAREEGATADCLSETVLASAAIPVLLPPRNINGALYADAGLRNHVFFNGIQAERERVGSSRTVNAYIIVNGALAPDQGAVRETLLDLAARSLSTVTDQGLRDSIADAAAVARERGWTVRVLIGDNIDLSACDGAQNSQSLFQSCVTAELFRQGFALGQTMTEDTWLNEAELRMRLGRL